MRKRRFSDLVRRLRASSRRRGYRLRDPEALAAKIERKRFGKRRFAAMGYRGRMRKLHHRVPTYRELGVASNPMSKWLTYALLAAGAWLLLRKKG